jgi:hypothetical protein
VAREHDDAASRLARQHDGFFLKLRYLLRT